MAIAGSTRRQATGRSVGSTEVIIVIPAGSYAHSMEGKAGRNIRPASATASVPQPRPIIVVDVFVPVAIRPIPLGVAVIFRRALKLILGNTNSIAAKIGVVLQACPGHRVVVFAHSQEAASQPSLQFLSSTPVMRMGHRKKKAPLSNGAFRTKGFGGADSLSTGIDTAMFLRSRAPINWLGLLAAFWLVAEASRRGRPCRQPLSSAREIVSNLPRSARSLGISTSVEEHSARTERGDRCPFR